MKIAPADLVFVCLFMFEVWNKCTWNSMVFHGYVITKASPVPITLSALTAVICTRRNKLRILSICSENVSSLATKFSRCYYTIANISSFFFFLKKIYIYVKVATICPKSIVGNIANILHLLVKFLIFEFNYVHARSRVYRRYE